MRVVSLRSGTGWIGYPHTSKVWTRRCRGAFHAGIMVHMDAHQRACRQSLRHLSNERNLPVFALDEEESLLMMAGRDVHIDVKRYELA